MTERRRRVYHRQQQVSVSVIILLGAPALSVRLTSRSQIDSDVTRKRQDPRATISSPTVLAVESNCWFAGAAQGLLKERLFFGQDFGASRCDIEDVDGLVSLSVDQHDFNVAAVGGKGGCKVVE